MKVYTLAEVAEMLHITTRTIYAWIKAGKLKAFKVGREWRVTEEALSEFCDKGTGR